ncbi:MAG: SDR family NAD(P)-dependent oxidoreductase [Opitutales bacterium]
MSVPNEMEGWKGRVALVTGASSGIGAAVARALSEAGLRVVMWARRMDRLEELAGKLPGEVLLRKVDLRSEEEILAGFEHLRERWGGCDALINNAGLGHKTSVMEGETGAWREMLEVNVLGLLICTREALSDMRRRENAGHVIHLSSMAGHRVPPGTGVYSATKFAVRALTEATRQELREIESPIRVSAISPGLVVTEFHEKFYQSRERAEEVYGRHQCLRAADVAQQVIWLLGQPPHAEIHDILMRPTAQKS